MELIFLWLRFRFLRMKAYAKLSEDLKKMCDKEGIINQSKRYAYFEKPSDKRRREESRRVKNIKKAQNLNPNLFSS